MSGHATPFHCPYCGDEDLAPHDPGGEEPAPHGGWECHSCLRVFTLRMTGQLPRPAGVGGPR